MKNSLPTIDVELHRRADSFADEDTVTYALIAFQHRPRTGRRSELRESMRSALRAAFMRNAAPLNAASAAPEREQPLVESSPGEDGISNVSIEYDGHLWMVSGRDFMLTHCTKPLYGASMRVLYETEDPPERGEAKAVAIQPGDEIESSAVGHCPECGCPDFEPNPDCVLCTDATPQPQPAPRFRDPTIEDAQKVRLNFNFRFTGNDPESSNADMLAALNAIGAKVEEKT